MANITTTPLVSVIIPTFNRSHLLPRAVESVLAQTFQDFELVIVDDASTDHTPKLLEGYQDHRIRCFRHNRRLGGSAARNIGIKAARGEYLAFLDSDDEWLPEKLAYQINKFDDSDDNVGVIYTGYSILNKDNVILTSVLPVYKGNMRDILLKWTIVTCSTMTVKKKCFKNKLFDETLQGCQDWDITIRLANDCEFDFVPEILVKKYLHGDGISTNLMGKIQALERMIEKYILDFPRYIRALIYYKIALYYILSNDFKKARQYMYKSIKSAPFRRAGYIHFILSLLFRDLHKRIIEKRSIERVDGNYYYY